MLIFYKNQEYMKSGLERHVLINQNMFAYGVILYDKNGVIKELKNNPSKS